MTYRCGIDGSMAKLLRVVPSEPRIVCDGCGVVRSVTTRSGLPATWFRGGRAAPRWEMVRTDDERLDYCPTCRVTRRVVEPGRTPSGTGGETL